MWLLAMATRVAKPSESRPIVVTGRICPFPERRPISGVLADPSRVALPFSIFPVLQECDASSVLDPFCGAGATAGVPRLPRPPGSPDAPDCELVVWPAYGRVGTSPAGRCCRVTPPRGLVWLSPGPGFHRCSVAGSFLDLGVCPCDRIRSVRAGMARCPGVSALVDTPVREVVTDK